MTEKINSLASTCSARIKLTVVNYVASTQPVQKFNTCVLDVTMVITEVRAKFANICYIVVNLLISTFLEKALELD